MMMMMDNKKFKLRISRIFNGSCKSREDVAPYHDVLEKSPLMPRSRSIPSAPPRPPPLPRPSICNPRNPPSLHINNTCIISYKEVQNFVHPTKLKTRSRSRSKSKSKVAAFSHFDYNPFYDRGGSRYSILKDDRGKKKKKISDDHDLFSSDDEREDDDYDEERTADTLFSSRSLSSSESSEKNRRRTRNRGGRRRAARSNDVTGVRGSMAVVKKSMDPYVDFRRSMVEMIIERQIFGEKELEQLLLCFLSLNSINLHNIIVQVFNEILDALFSM